MKNYCFTVDDNIRCLKELTEEKHESIFEHPYLATYLELHRRYGVKVQLNLFYRTDGFTLSDMTDRYKEEWRQASDWLRLSFHSDRESCRPYESSAYEEVYEDCRAVQREIVRFASPEALGATTTIHYCLTTPEGLRALRDNGVRGLLGLYGTEDSPTVSYCTPEEECRHIRRGETVTVGGMAFTGIDAVLNCYPLEDIIPLISSLTDRDTVRIMIHEQYFYKDYKRYQPDFGEKLDRAIGLLSEKGYVSRFLEELIPSKED